MRIDKFIWAVRLFKTRSLASKSCTSEKVKLNDEFVKPAKTVSIKDEISIKTRPIWRSFKIIELPKSRVGPKLVEDYIVEITSKNDLEELNIFNEAQKQMRRDGFSGRPTKKDRRDINKFNS